MRVPRILLLEGSTNALDVQHGWLVSTRSSTTMTIGLRRCVYIVYQRLYILVLYVKFGIHDLQGEVRKCLDRV